MQAQSKDKKIINKARRRIVFMITSIVSFIFLAGNAGYGTYICIEERNAHNFIIDLVLKNDGNINGNIGIPTDGIIPEKDNVRIFSFTVDTKTYQYSIIYGYDNYEEYLNKNIKLYVSLGEGNINNVYFKSKIKEGDTKIFVAYDRTVEIINIRRNIISTSFSTILSITAVCILSIIFSQIILKPIEDTQEKQKQFISNASHELKTPLTIIDANASLLKSNNQNNKWINNILNETKNMNEMISDMLSLASIEEQDSVIETFELSKTISNIALTFDAVFYENQIDYQVNIEDNIQLFGNKKDVEKLLKILIDNARKYVEEKGLIEVSLINDNGIYLSVYNSGCTIKDNERQQIFNRFYRDSTSRNGSNVKGSGLGLAILKEICEKYNYKIKLDTKENIFYKITIQFK